jgi:hypothetical protein
MSGSPPPDSKKPAVPSPKPRDLPVSFRTIFWVDVLFTVGTFAANLYLVTRPVAEQTDVVKSLAEGCNSVWKIGVGGFFGLLFGKGMGK